MQVDVTGLCILYPTCAIHLLEAQSVTLWAILRDLMGPKGKEAMMAEGTARVIAFSEDIGARLFTSWGSSFVHEKNTTEQVQLHASRSALIAALGARIHRQPRIASMPHPCACYLPNTTQLNMSSIHPAARYTSTLLTHGHRRVLIRWSRWRPWPR